MNPYIGAPQNPLYFSLFLLIIFLIRIFLYKPSSYPSGKAPVDVFEEQVLFLSLDKNREAVSGEVVVCGSSRPKIPYSFNRKSTPIFPGDRFWLHISCGIKVGRDFDVDPFRVRCRNGSHGLLPPFLQCVILLHLIPSVSVYSL